MSRDHDATERKESARKAVLARLGEEEVSLGVCVKAAAAVLTLVVGAAVGCTSTSKPQPKESPVALMGSWDLGEVKSCTEGRFEGEETPIMLCDPEAGAAFYMTLGGLKTARDEKTKSKLRDLFAGHTKTFEVVFEPRPAGYPPIWKCVKGTGGLHCDTP